jgi:hypothetical protein
METAYAMSRADSIRTASMPVARRYAGMELKVDTSEVTHEFMRTLDEAVASAMTSAIALFGQRAHSMLTRLEVTVTRGTSGEGNEGHAASRFVTIRVEPTSTRPVRFQTADAEEPSREILEYLVRDWFAIEAYDALPATIRRWVSVVLPLAPVPRRDRSAYRAIARANTRSARACLEGSVSSCLPLLAIGPRNDTLASWLNANERRERLMQHRNKPRLFIRQISGAEGPELYARCTIQRDDQACRNALRILSLPAPVMAADRAQLLRFAIETGGEEAYARLENSSDDEVGPILETVAQIPLDSLIGRWMTMVKAAKPASPVPDGPELLISFALLACAVAAGAGRRP